MSFLAPLYIAGMAALSLPLIFHLIRRTPQGRRVFSSLMFLAPSPPRLTRRSRLDNLLLLLLRALALALLVLAFARPFFREAAHLAFDAASGRRVAILLDTSASMRRGNLWRQATATVEQVLADLEPVDDVGLYVFDDQLSNIVDLGSEGHTRGMNKRTILKRRLAELRPTWAHTDLGSALASVADALDLLNASHESDADLQIVLVSDLQRGARINALWAYKWPAEVQVAIHRIAPAQPTNASIKLLIQPDDFERDQQRVRITNAANSLRDQFYVRWSCGDTRQANDNTMAVYVPAGQSRVVRMSRPQEGFTADRLVLSGDHAEFDNVCYVVPSRQEDVTVVYIGNDTADDPNGLQYYLDMALSDNARRRVRIVPYRGDQPLHLSEDQPPVMVVVTDRIPETTVGQLKAYMEKGGTVFMVPRDQEAVASLMSFDSNVVVPPEQANPAAGSYAMLGEIDFTHPVFSALANPRYSDFTKIHFWNHRRVALSEQSTAHVVARFDSGQPALWEQDFGKGQWIVLTSGWHPDDSQLALSSKFVPLLDGYIQEASGGPREMARYTVNQPVAVPASVSSTTGLVIHKPDGSEFQLEGSAKVFSHADQPGIYRIERETLAHEFAVNVASEESVTVPLDDELLEQYGVNLGNHPTATQKNQRRRQLRDVELETRQTL